MARPRVRLIGRAWFHFAAHHPAICHAPASNRGRRTVPPALPRVICVSKAWQTLSLVALLVTEALACSALIASAGQATAAVHCQAGEECNGS